MTYGAPPPYPAAPPPITPGEAKSNIATDVILSIVTCGFWVFFWQARQFKALNALVGEARFDFLKWLLLTFVTCGIWHWYTQYLKGMAVQEIQARLGRRPTDNLHILSLVLTIFGLPIVADAIIQNEINQLF